MATTAYRQARFARNENGGPICAGGPEEPGMREAASQTFKQGAVIYLVAGLITICDNEDIKDAGDLFGFALQDASGTTNTQLQVRRIRGGDVYIMNCESNGAAVATALADAGKLVNFNVVSGNLVADILPAGSAAVNTVPFGRLIDFYEEDTIGDTGGRVYVLIPDQPYIY